MHLKEMPFSCDLCKLSFSENFKLVRHNNTKHHKSLAAFFGDSDSYISKDDNTKQEIKLEKNVEVFVDSKLENDTLETVIVKEEEIKEEIKEEIEYNEDTKEYLL